VLGREDGPSTPAVTPLSGLPERFVGKPIGSTTWT
jgi:hypothetical protein